MVGKKTARGGKKPPITYSPLSPAIPPLYPGRYGGVAGTAGLSSDHAVCLWIPRFALRSEVQRQPELYGQAVALLSSGDARRIWEVSPQARRAGVRPGMTVNQAVGLCPQIKLREPDPVHYDEQFSNLILALGDVSPVIEPAELGRVFIGVDGLEGLHGSPEEQVNAVAGTIQDSHMTVVGNERLYHSLPSFTATDRPVGSRWEGIRLGWARGKFVAGVAATKAKRGEATIVPDAQRTDFLVSQPVEVLPIDADTCRRLRQLGITTLGTLVQLPAVALVSQFGRQGHHLWLLASGEIVDPVVGHETPEPIVAQVDFPTPVTDRAMLLHALDRLIERALRHPKRSGWRVLQVGVHGRQEHGSSWKVHVNLKCPSADRNHIAAPLKTRLEQASPTTAVETLAVEFTAFVRGTDELQLFARDAASSARAGRRRALRAAVREIKNRFRHCSLCQVVEVQPQSRLPERRYALIDYDP